MAPKAQELLNRGPNNFSPVRRLARDAALMAAMTFSLVAGAAGAAHEPRTLRVALELLPRAFANPHTTSLSPTIFSIAALYDGLTRFDDDGNLSPALAQGWERIDPLTWRFRLRPGVTFSNGRPLTADAFVTAVNYLSSADAARENLPREIPYLKSARRIDDLTFDLVTTEPIATLPRQATAIMAAEPDAWRQLGRDGFSRAPVGTGPFKIASMDVNRWELTAAPGAWRAPKVDRLEFVALPDALARVQALAAGRVDVAMSIGPDNADALGAAGGRLGQFTGPTVVAISLMTVRGGPMADVRVRRALNHAIDRQRIVEVLLVGATVPTGQPAPRRALGYDPAIAPYAFDPDLARRLLAEAGYPDGFTFTLAAPISASANDSLVYVQIQADLRDIGVAMTIDTLPLPVFLERSSRTTHTSEAFTLAWTSWPAMDILRPMRGHSCLNPAPFYCEPSVTPMITAAIAEMDEAVAVNMRRTLARHYHDQASGIFLYELPILVGLGPRVENFEMFGYRIHYDRIRLGPD